MKRYRNQIFRWSMALLLLIAGISAVNTERPTAKITAWYFRELHLFQDQMSALQESVSSGQPADSLQAKFIRARLTYKRIELILEYYFPQYSGFLNPPAIRMAEDKIPPQGLQVIEDQLFPKPRLGNNQKLLGDLYKLNSVIQMLLGVEGYFQVNAYMPDALMEELYRIVTLGITGFDSPVALKSIPESAEALVAVKYCLSVLKENAPGTYGHNYARIVELLNAAEAYCRANPDFEAFDRMYFIRTYINPVCDWLGLVKLEMGLLDKPRQGLLPMTPGISKYYNLFDARIQSPGFFAPDSVLSTPELISLGKKLFHEPLLAGNNNRSCASCHNPEKAFTDGRPLSLNLTGGTVHRNAPTLFNAALQRDLFYDHRQKFLENLVDEVLANKDEMNSSAGLAANKISQIPSYNQWLYKAFGDSSISARRLSKAIATYVRSLVSLNSRFDLYMRGHNQVMNAEEIKGFNVFMGKGKCGTCHFAPLFNGMKPPLYWMIESEVIGVPGNADSLNPRQDEDMGRTTISGSEVHIKAFKTPTVRNIELTAPYMHNGIYRTLEEVVEFYNKGGGRGLGLEVPNQTLPFDHLNLDAGEKKSLVAFMRSLTDTIAVRQY